MIVAFDLDDTLYPESTYVESGFRAVAQYLWVNEGWDPSESLRVMKSSVRDHGRGRAFDDVLRRWDRAPTRRSLERLTYVYRHHVPAITLPVESAEVLSALACAGHALYVITDGHKLVQATKIARLGLDRWMRHSYITNRYGRAWAKPSTRVFELLLRREAASPTSLVYVGDDPSKDFLPVRALGGFTVRVRTGRHAAVEAAPGWDADVTVEGLPAVLAIVDEMGRRN